MFVKDTGKQTAMWSFQCSLYDSYVVFSEQLQKIILLTAFFWAEMQGTLFDVKALLKSGTEDGDAS